MTLEQIKHSLKELNTADRVQLISILVDELPREQNAIAFRRLDDIQPDPEDKPRGYSTIHLHPVLISASELLPDQHMDLVLYLLERIPEDAVAWSKERIRYRESQFLLDDDDDDIWE